MSNYITSSDIEGRIYVAVPGTGEDGLHHVAYARSTQEALQIIHYLNGGADPAAAAVVAGYTQMMQELPTPVADALAGAVNKAKKVIPRRRSKGGRGTDDEVYG